MVRLVQAGGGLQRCLDQAMNHNGEPPTSTKEADGTWGDPQSEVCG